MWPPKDAVIAFDVVGDAVLDLHHVGWALGAKPSLAFLALLNVVRRPAIASFVRGYLGPLPAPATNVYAAALAALSDLAISCRQRPVELSMKLVRGRTDAAPHIHQARLVWWLFALARRRHQVAERRREFCVWRFIFFLCDNLDALKAII